MTLHIFNPDHDIALASNLDNFTAPHAGRQLRHDLGWLPALWANEGDVILVDDEETAIRTLRRATGRLTIKPHPKFVTTKNIPSGLSAISVWGWNSALKSQLHRWGTDEVLLPKTEILNDIRELSHRRTSAFLLASLKETGSTVGEATELHSLEDIKGFIAQGRKTVLKAPWSSSGRGVRFVENEMTASMDGWAKNILSSQGSVMAEPYYNKVKDLGIEFEAQPDGSIVYLGLSLFHTMNGAYTGNILATEERKQQMMAHYLEPSLLEDIKEHICQKLADILKGRYVGPFGVDMMIVAQEGKGFLLHPCVEINLRRTMGHVALALTRLLNPKGDEGIVKVMRIIYEHNQYKLRIQQPK